MSDDSGRGPKQGVCAVCGREIDAYESRYYNDDGRMVCAWRGDASAERASCRSYLNMGEFRKYWTDG